MLNVAIENQNGWNYSAPAPHKTGAGIATPTMTTAHNRAQAVFLCVKHSHIQIMVGRAGQPQGWPVSVVTGCSNPVRLTTHEIATSGGESFKLTIEAAIMATSLPFLTLTQPSKMVALSLRLLRLRSSSGKCTKTLFRRFKLSNARRSLTGLILSPSPIPTPKAKTPNVPNHQKRLRFPGDGLHWQKPPHSRKPTLLSSTAWRPNCARITPHLLTR